MKTLLVCLAVSLSLASFGRETPGAAAPAEGRFAAQLAVELERVGERGTEGSTFKTTLVSGDGRRLVTEDGGLAITVGERRTRAEVRIEAVEGTSPRQFRAEVRLREGETTVAESRLMTLEGQEAEVTTADGRGGTFKVSLIVETVSDAAAEAPAGSPSGDAADTEREAAAASPAPTESERRIHEALLRRPLAEFGMRGTTLGDVAAQIRTLWEINVVLDDNGLAEEGVTSATKVDFVMPGSMRLGDALTLLLEPRGLGYAVEHEVLKITSKTRSEGPLTVQAYHVTDLVVPPSAEMPKDAAIPKEGDVSVTGVGPRRVELDSLVELITGTIRPASWESVGGYGVIRANETTLSLVVRQTTPVHEKIADLLGELRELASQGVALEATLLRLDAAETERLAGRVGAEPQSGFVTSVGPAQAAALRAAASDPTVKGERVPTVTVHAGQIATVRGVVFQGDRSLNWNASLRPEIASGSAIRLTVTEASGGMEAESIEVGDGGSALIDVTPVTLTKVEGQDRLFQKTDGTRLVLLVTARFARVGDVEAAAGGKRGSRL